jgi:hypothetical protein
MFERLIDRVCGTAEWVHSAEDESADPSDSFRSSRTKKWQSMVKADISKRLRDFQKRLIQIFKPPYPGS